MAASLRYKDKVVLITGGARGIGKGCVKTFVENGAKVAFCDIDAVAKTTEEEMNELGPGEAYYIKCDLRDEAQIKNLIDKVIEKYGTIDCLINNAGYHPGHFNIENVTAEDFKNILQINVIAMFLTSKYAIPYLRLAKGNIINMSSMVAHLGQKDSFPYTASKGAVASMSKTFAISEAKHNVRVNTISPGLIDTPLWDEVQNKQENPEEFYQQTIGQQLIGRIGKPSEIGLACLFLAADAGFSTGIDINVSGGKHISHDSRS